MTKLMVNDIELQTTSDDYVSVKGGKLQGTLTHSSSIIAQKDADDGYLALIPDADNTGAAIYMFGKDCPSTTKTPHGFNAVPGGVVWYTKGTYTNKLIIDPTKDYVTINGFGVPYTANSGTVGGAGNPIYIDNYEIKACTKLYRHDITTSASSSNWRYFLYFYSTDGTAITTGEALTKALYNAGYTSLDKSAFCVGGYQTECNGDLKPEMVAYATSAGGSISHIYPDGTASSTRFTTGTYDPINDVVTEVR